MIKKIIVGFAMVLALTGCVHTPFISEKVSKELPPIPADKAQIVFMRPSGLWSGTYCFVFDVSNPDQKELTGMLSGKDQFVVNVEPGQKMFMATNFHLGDLTKLDAVAGKRYYALIRPVFGAGYKFRPIRRDGTTDYNTSISEFKQWQQKPLVEMTAEGITYSTTEKFKQNVDATYNQLFANWNAKTDEERAILTFRASDGAKE